MITVVNVKSFGGRYGCAKHGVVVVMRGQSLLGNRFVIGKDGNRGEVIEKYRRWLWGEMKKGGAALDELKGLAGEVMKGSELKLGCCCTPLQCHAEVVKSAVEWLIRNEGK